VKAESGGSLEEPGKEPGSVQQEARTCPVCGTKFSAAGDSDFCPVCILRGAPSGESTAAGGARARACAHHPGREIDSAGQHVGDQEGSAYVPTTGRQKSKFTLRKRPNAAVPGSPAESAPSFPKTPGADAQLQKLRRARCPFVTYRRNPKEGGILESPPQS
jgi:hypothetical protein